MLLARGREGGVHTAVFTVAAAAVVGLSALNAIPAIAQSVRSTPVTAAPATQTVPAGQCAAFGKYLVDELKTYPNDLSPEFRKSAARFLRASCTNRDADGEIHFVTMNAQDDASLTTARVLMGRFDIFGASGVRGCHKPRDGVCPAATSSTPSPVTTDTDCKTWMPTRTMSDTECLAIKSKLLDAQAKIKAEQKACMLKLLEVQEKAPDRVKALGPITRDTACELANTLGLD